MQDMFKGQLKGIIVPKFTELLQNKTNGECFSSYKSVRLYVQQYV